jgi:hypothetical protein
MCSFVCPNSDRIYKASIRAVLKQRYGTWSSVLESVNLETLAHVFSHIWQHAHILSLGFGILLLAVGLSIPFYPR